MKIILLAISIVLIGFQFGCSLLQVKDPTKEAQEVYKKDLNIIVDGEKYSGVGVLPLKAMYEFSIIPEDKADRLIIQTCHRDLTIDKPKTGWFSNKYSFRFSPIAGLETNRNCAIEIASLTKKQKNAFAYLDFIDSRQEISLSASLKCNGEFSRSTGVGICQAAAGLRQGITFQSQVILEGIESECDVMESKDGYFWEWNIAPSKCIYYFVSREKHKNGKRLAFRLNSLGFTSTPYKD